MALPVVALRQAVEHARRLISHRSLLLIFIGEPFDRLARARRKPPGVTTDKI
jgi:hypothetical protein